MYGVVNQAIEGLVTENFGTAAWMQVKQKSGVTVDAFLNTESYDDAITYQLAGAAAEVLNLPLSQVLIAFGEYWILNTGRKNYGALLKAGGNSLQEFMINLPNFHSRIMLMYPKLTPPEFRISDIKDNSLRVHYYSKREGLTDFVVGLLQGIAKLYEITTCRVTILTARPAASADHDIFLMEW